MDVRLIDVVLVDVGLIDVFCTIFWSTDSLCVIVHCYKSVRREDGVNSSKYKFRTSSVCEMAISPVVSGEGGK